ncbi:MAG: oxidoreductase, partial [Myxococcaceae bacterium]
PMNRPLYPLPAESVAWHLSILRTASDAASLQAMLASNRALYDQARVMGGTRYSIGAIPDFTPADWQSHFGPAWNAFEDAKRRFDPDNILAPGQGIFS